MSLFKNQFHTPNIKKGRKINTHFYPSDSEGQWVYCYKIIKKQESVSRFLFFCFFYVL
jgi:hypothetical protein